MKNKIEILKTAILNVSLYAGSLGMVFTATSCSNKEKSNDSKEIANEHNEAKFNNTDEKDAKFLVNAAEISLEEIRLGEIAQNNSEANDVKELGKVIETEHQKSLKNLQVLAAKKQITVPATLTEDGRDDFKKLANKTGADFNKDYCDMMVKGHKDAIDKFEKASTDAADPDIRSWASSMLPMLRTHLDRALNCQKKFEKYNSSL